PDADRSAGLPQFSRADSPPTPVGEYARLAPRPAKTPPPQRSHSAPPARRRRAVGFQTFVDTLFSDCISRRTLSAQRLPLPEPLFYTGQVPKTMQENACASY